MRVHYPLSLFLLLAAGCADDGSDSTYGDDGSDALKGSGVGTDVPDMCAEENMTVEVNGRDIYDVGDPAVGDEWAVRMFCQGILMTGANLLKFTPPLDRRRGQRDDRCDLRAVRSCHHAAPVWEPAVYLRPGRVRRPARAIKVSPSVHVQNHSSPSDLVSHPRHPAQPWLCGQ